MTQAELIRTLPNEVREVISAAEEARFDALDALSDVLLLGEITEEQYAAGRHALDACGGHLPLV